MNIVAKIPVDPGWQVLVGDRTPRGPGLHIVASMNYANLRWEDVGFLGFPLPPMGGMALMGLAPGFPAVALNKDGQLFDGELLDAAPPTATAEQKERSLDGWR